MDDATITLDETLQIGGYSTLDEAGREAREFAMPEVFVRRSAVFPNPLSYSVEVTPVASEAKHWVPPLGPMNAAYVELKIKISGAKKNVDRWLQNTRHALYIRSPGAYRIQSEKRPLAHQKA